MPSTENEADALLRLAAFAGLLIEELERLPRPVVDEAFMAELRELRELALHMLDAGQRVGRSTG